MHEESTESRIACQDIDPCLVKLTYCIYRTIEYNSCLFRIFLNKNIELSIIHHGEYDFTYEDRHLRNIKLK